MECVSTPFGRALGSHSRGQGFESPYLHHTKTRNINLMFLVFVSANPRRYGDSKASVKKTCRGHVFSESADEIVSHRK